MAFEVLRLVEEGGYASDLLAARMGGLDSRDAGLAEEIVLGSLRRQGQLDFLIGHFSGRAAARLDAEVRIALRMGVYQMRYLERVPAHAAVSESAELVKRARKRSAAGFVNAVLAEGWPGAGGLARPRHRAFPSRLDAGALGAAVRRGDGREHRAGQPGGAGDVRAGAAP